MPRPSKKKAAAQNNWQSAVAFIKTGTKRALAILTPRKKKRKIAVDKENDNDSILSHSPPDDISETRSFETRSCPDDEFFQSPGPSLVPGFNDLPTDARSQFWFFLHKHSDITI
ncbi:hypothetical protein B0H13DRAFT_2306119 [Mycena leptocephala]|nr:hypothetical protein B0H13DRAFT_2306119 [Mycena leptocephala]